MTLVFRTSTGLPTTQAVKPAMAEQTRWQGIPSYMRFALSIISLAWSNVAISAALIIEFRMILGPKPVHSPFILYYYFFIPFFSDDLHIGIRNRFISSFMDRLLSLALESNFNNISWICNRNSNSSCCQSCSYSVKDRNWANMIFPDIKLLDGLIKTNPQTSKH